MKPAISSRVRLRLVLAGHLHCRGTFPLGRAGHMIDVVGATVRVLALLPALGQLERGRIAGRGTRRTGNLWQKDEEGER